LGKRRGLLQDIRHGEDGTVYAEFLVPTRGVLGFRQPFLNVTRGTGTFNTLFEKDQPLGGEIETQEHGSLISHETGTTSAYALQHLQQRGTFFIHPGDKVYAGQVVGQTIRNEDMVLNVCRTKHMTGHRSAFKAIVDALSPPRIMSLDDAIDYLGGDELLEVTPEALRLRKKELQHGIRQRAVKNAKKG